ncbi:hypothetical protein M9H77_11180 [Catharanthus roseus]|uniref:Uncharacterized protein n=1 Tax=Catharanthus roseus TaxID=4058 RepID=A0ACC0BDT2_CATRO|nr:hypothetical protein M9H77_11180 [Catharanthus roseus]
MSKFNMKKHRIFHKRRAWKEAKKMIELQKAITKAMKGFSIQENARERSRMMDYKLCKDQLVEETEADNPATLGKPALAALEFLFQNTAGADCTREADNPATLGKPAPAALEFLFQNTAGADCTREADNGCVMGKDSPSVF